MDTTSSTVLADDPSKAPEARQRRSLRMAPRLWQALDELARAEGISTNALLEVIASRLVDGSDEAERERPGAIVSADDSGGAYKGVYIRLRPMDRAAFKEQAAAAGYTLTGWLTALARASARKGPLFVRSEVEGLIDALRQFAAVGRLLNTVVHQLHRTGRWAGNLDLYARLLENVKRSRARIEDAIARAHERAEGI
ncbi:hypothetical protein ACVALR_14410 [Stenotrophomonas maltophilia]